MTKLSKIWLFLALSTLFPAACVMAAETELSLDEALRIADAENPRLQAARHAVEATAGSERAARAEFLPELTASAFWADYDGDLWYARFLNPTAPGTLNPDAPPTDAGSFSTTRMGVLKLGQTLYAGGALRAGVRARRVERALAEQELAARRLELAYEVRQAYYGVLLAERAAEVAGQSVRRSEETLKTVRLRLASEEALKVEELGAASYLARDRHRLVQAENDRRFARLSLHRLLGREPADAYRLTGTLEKPPEALDEEEAVRQALVRQPAVAAAKLRLELAETLGAAGRSHFKPKLQLEAYYAWIDNETLFEGTNVGATLNVAIPFLRDLRAGAGEVGRAKARHEMEESAFEELVAALGLQARQAVRQVEEAYSAVEVARQALAYQREKHRVSESAFREQLVTADEMLDEQAALSEAELTLYRALFLARLNEAELRKVVGG